MPDLIVLFFSGMGLKSGYSGSLGTCITWNYHKYAHRGYGCIVFALFLHLVSKDLNNPNYDALADNAITPGSIGRLGSLFYICEYNTIHGTTPEGN